MSPAHAPAPLPPPPWAATPHPPEPPRAFAARRAVEAVVGLALLGATVAGLLEERSPPARTPWASIPVDVAHDGPGRLRLLPGIGPVRADAVLADRRAAGPLRALDDLARVPGIGRKTVEALRAAGAVVRDAPRPGGAPAGAPADAPAGAPADAPTEGRAAGGPTGPPSAAMASPDDGAPHTGPRDRR